LNGHLAVLGGRKNRRNIAACISGAEARAAEARHATGRHPEKARALAEQLGIEASTDNALRWRAADIVLLAVKPQAVREVLEEINYPR